MQVLNKYDKEQLVIELQRQGKTIRQIAEAAHLSFSDIGTIIRREDGHDKDDDIETKDLKNKTKTTQALHLFKNGKKPIDVAIELDISANEIEDILQEYWMLNQLDELTLVYYEIKTFLPSILKLIHCLKKHKMLSEKNISDVLRYVGNDLPQLTDRVQSLTNAVINLEDQKRNLMNKIILWNAQLSDLGKAIDMRNQQLKRMGK
jgi:hypothetical protein